MAKFDHNYKGLNSYGKRNEQLLKNMAYTAPEQSFLMDREEIAELEQIIQDVCGSAEPLVGVDLFDSNGTDDGPLPWRRIEVAVDTMLAEISYRATRLHAIQFGAHFRTRDSFPEITYDSTHHVYQNGEYVQRTPGEKTQDERGRRFRRTTVLRDGFQQV